MPLVKVEILKGRNNNYKQAIFDSIHAALIEALKIPDNDRIQRLYELDRKHFDFPDSKYSDKYILIEISMFQGRSLEAKRQLYAAIVRNLESSPGIDGKDIFIVLHESPLENWGIRGGIPANEAKLEFKVEV